MLRAKCMKARSIRAGSNPAGSRGAQNPLCSAGHVFCLFLVIRNIVPSNTVPPSLILNVASNIVLMPPRSPCNQERYNWGNILLSDSLQFVRIGNETAQQLLKILLMLARNGPLGARTCAGC